MNDLRPLTLEALLMCGLLTSAYSILDIWLGVLLRWPFKWWGAFKELWTLLVVNLLSWTYLDDVLSSWIEPKSRDVFDTEERFTRCSESSPN